MRLETVTCVPADDERFSLVFDKLRAEDRRAFVERRLRNRRPRDEEVCGRTVATALLEDFLAKRAAEEMRRTMPDLLDGLTDVQRAVVRHLVARGVFGPDSAVSVARLAMDAASSLDEAEELAKAAIGLAQSFVGANALPLLVAEGQFGSRAQCGRDAAQPHLIRTYLPYYFTILFDGDAPIIPLVLVNGTRPATSKTAEGWRTLVLPHSLSGVIAAVRAAASGKEVPRLNPGWRGFRGSVEERGGGVVTRGVVRLTKKDDRVHSTKTLLVEELPVGTGAADYVSHLRTLEKSGYLAGFERDTDGFLLHYPNTKACEEALVDRSKLAEKLELIRSFDASNATLSSAGVLNMYQDADAIFAAWFDARLRLFRASHGDQAAAVWLEKLNSLCLASSTYIVA
jgi:DNA topoisomerase-2